MPSFNKNDLVLYLIITTLIILVLTHYYITYSEVLFEKEVAQT